MKYNIAIDVNQGNGFCTFFWSWDDINKRETFVNATNNGFPLKRLASQYLRIHKHYLSHLVYTQFHGAILSDFYIVKKY